MNAHDRKSALKIMRLLAPLFAVLMLAPVASAHPGHGNGETGVLHYVSQPVHWMPIVALAAFLTLVLLLSLAWRRNGKVAEN